MTRKSTYRYTMLGMIAASCAIASASFVSTPAFAQPPASQAAMLRVRLRQQDTVPVIGAEVSVKSGKAEQVVRSDSTGMARVEGLDRGSVEIRVRRIGFKQAMILARVEPGENEVTIELDGTMATLAEKRIIGNRTASGRHEDFEMRLKRNDANAVVTEAQIEKRNPVKLSTMLRGMAGLRLADSLGQTVAISQRGSKLSNGKPVPCVMRIMVDGIVMSPQTSIDGIFPKDVYGVEVFYGPARIPLNVGSMRTDTWCGMIAIWTK